MKNVMLATAAAVVGFAGFASNANADHRFDRRDRRDVGVRIAGAVLNELIGPRRGPVYVTPRPAPVIVSPIARRHYHVTWHMDGTKRMHLHNHSLAHRYEQELERLGAHVRLIHNGGHYDLVYHMHGSRSRSFRSHSSAHYFEQRLERMGFHAKVVHH